MVTNFYLKLYFKTSLTYYLVSRKPVTTLAFLYTNLFKEQKIKFITYQSLAR